MRLNKAQNAVLCYIFQQNFDLVLQKGFIWVQCTQKSIEDRNLLVGPVWGCGNSKITHFYVDFLQQM